MEPDKQIKKQLTSLLNRTQSINTTRLDEFTKKQLETYEILLKKFAFKGKYFFIYKKKMPGKENLFFRTGKGTYLEFCTTFWDTPPKYGGPSGQYYVRILYRDNKQNFVLSLYDQGVILAKKEIVTPLINALPNFYTKTTNKKRQAIDYWSKPETNILTLISKYFDMFDTAITNNIKLNRIFKKMPPNDFIRYSDKILTRIEKFTQRSIKTIKENTEMRSEIDHQDSAHDKNKILYGPPGTGKTFHTKRRAVEIINGSKNGANSKLRGTFPSNKEENPFSKIIEEKKAKGKQPPQAKYLGYFLYNGADDKEQIVDKAYSKMVDSDGFTINQYGIKISKEGLKKELTNILRDIKTGKYGWKHYKLVEKNNKIMIINK